MYPKIMPRPCCSMAEDLGFHSSAFLFKSKINPSLFWPNQNDSDAGGISVAGHLTG